MFFHKDLELYLNKNFRSFDYLKNIWRIIEFDLIYIVGMINSGNITINLESDYINLIATSNFKNIFSKTYRIDFSHSLILCYDFVTDITINVTDPIESFYFSNLNCKFYYDRNTKNDEGFIECSVTSNFSVFNLDSFKLSLLSLLSKELQFVINKNVFQLDIEKTDLIVSDIDSLFEYTRAHSEIQQDLFLNTLKSLSFRKEDKQLLVQLIKKLENINV